MRTVLAAFAVVTVAAMPAQAQKERDRNTIPFPRTLQEDRQPAFDYTPIVSADRDQRPLLVMVSAPRPGNRQPYRAIVTWSGAPDHYWSMAFDYDCRSRSMSRVDTDKRRWYRGYKADDSFPIADTYRGDFASLVAPAICDGQKGEVSATAAKAFKFARDFSGTDRR